MSLDHPVPKAATRPRHLLGCLGITRGDQGKGRVRWPQGRTHPVHLVAFRRFYSDEANHEERIGRAVERLVGG